MPADLHQGVPEDFPRFLIPGHERTAAIWNRYLWHHYDSRLHNGPVLFNKEYLMLADLWMHATEKRLKLPIQDVHRKFLLEVNQDPDGYIQTHQHFSHAHEGGWPFPLWAQIPGGSQGKTMGWHFQMDGPSWQWIWHFLKAGHPQSFGEAALKGWQWSGCRSLGIKQNAWHLQTQGGEINLVSPQGVTLEAFQAPFVQVRWNPPSSPEEGKPIYFEWQKEGDQDFSNERRLEFPALPPAKNQVSGHYHQMLALYRHPEWRGKIQRLRIRLPGEIAAEVPFSIDSIFTAYDTRHSINNPIFILSCWHYARWTGDLEFLKIQLPKMRLALQYQQGHFRGIELGHLRNPWWGHDGIAGFRLLPDGSKEYRPGHGIGNNYWDLMPFGWDDAYATSQYHAALLTMAELETWLTERKDLDWPSPPNSGRPQALLEQASRVRQVSNAKFWSPTTERFVACIDQSGEAHDYGYTFVNLEAIWYGLASRSHGEKIMDWIEGRRTIDGDDSQGEDIYRWRFGPRSSTRRNVEWYGHAWHAPESIPWGGQVQDGGAVLGFSFFDLWARLKLRGPENAWQRLLAITDWEQEVWKSGGYRAYYEGGKRGTTLQGGGTAGGLGIDFEFFESSMLPSIFIHGFLGIRPAMEQLLLQPDLPDSLEALGVQNLEIQKWRLHLVVSRELIRIQVEQEGPAPLSLRLGKDWLLPSGKALPANGWPLPGEGEFSFRNPAGLR